MKGKRKKSKKHKGEQRAPATTRSTAGPGFDFEDKVAASLFLKILSGEILPGIEGLGTRLQMQTSSLGWLVDDVLVTTTVAPEDHRYLAVSCKSNVQVSLSGLPRDFLDRAWNQWLQANNGPMRRERDFLLLATGGRHPQFQATWSEIRRAAASPDPVLSLARIRAVPKQRRIFEGIGAAAQALGYSVTDNDVLALIQNIDVSPSDFHLNSSEDENRAVALCRGLLVNGSIAEGRRLWDELVSRARSARVGHGTIEIVGLWRDLRSQFQLKGLPDFLPSCDLLKALTEDYKNRIESAFVSGYALERKDVTDRLGKIIAAAGVAVAYGESGTGKSAVVSSVLDHQFSDEQQIWFGPDEIAAALSEVERPKLGLSHPLLSVLDASPHPQNILVIDAAERVSRDLVPRLKKFVADLLACRNTDGLPAWRVVIVGQTVSWISGQLQELASCSPPPHLEIGPLSKSDVQLALRSTEKLGWLAVHDETVAALTNLRALAWVIEAAPRFQGQASISSLTAIADRLWGYWTEENPEIERLLMRLGAREASFEHSFALTDLDASDASALRVMPQHCPLRRNARNRYEFQHDLASDWARFQWLKQIAHDTPQWAALASNPLWNGALRMLGQFLLRQPEGTRSAWDAALEAAEQANDTMRLAADILLDALCLDPEAETFLEQRVEMLFANNGARLTRLLRRFEHIATVPGVSPELLRTKPSLSLYMEAKLRTPVFGRWPSIAKFLAKHRDRAAALISPVVASLCERWLTSTPYTLGSGPMPFRKEFAELAHSTARELQFEQAKRTIFTGDIENGIYRAALLGAPELPDEISQWALEMAQRRDYQPDMVERIQEYRKQQAQRHQERLKTDAEYRQRIERQREAAGSGFIPSGRKLPPWPMGPRRHVDRHFAETVRQSPAVYPLMRLRPAVASEVLLAATIEGSPEESYDRHSWDEGLGLQYDGDAYPTAYWKSPFYAYLQIDTDAALRALHQLIKFCTERWVAAARRRSGSTPPKKSIRLADGTTLQFAGNFSVFTWSSTNSHRVGQLASGLAALERWLCDLIDRGTDITAIVDDLLRQSRSVSILGVLLNVGKYRPELFKGSLKPLVAVHRLYLWDYRSVKNLSGTFDGMSWLLQGRAIFDLAQKWAQAPHRKTILSQVVSELIRHDREFAKFILASTATWTCREEEKESIEFRILVAELDHGNYRTIKDATGKEVVQIQYPADVQKAMEAFYHKHAVSNQTLTLPYQARTALSNASYLTAEQASAFNAALMAIDAAAASNLDDDMKESARVAGAVTLLVKAPEWLERNPAAREKACAIFRAAMASIGDEKQSRLGYVGKQSILEFAAHVVATEWIAASTVETDEAMMRILTCGDDRAVQVLALHAYQNRALLGARWWRLLYVALLCSGLSVLAPGHGDDESIRIRWERWLAWLRKRRLSGVSTDIPAIDPLGIAKRVERFELRRWTQRYAKDKWRPDFPPDRRFSGGLDTHFLQRMFFWLVSPEAVPASPAEAAESAVLVSAFWAHEAWCISGSTDDDDKGYDPLSQGMGYALATAIARCTLNASASDAEQFWKPVLELGPRAHYAIGSFLTDWFNLITETADIDAYAVRWRPMIEYIHSAPNWSKGRFWFYGHRLERQVLGFGSDTYLIRTPRHALLIAGMRDLYEAWVNRRLSEDEDNLAGFCGFMSTEAGRVLRLEALVWVAEVFKNDSEAGKWYRESTTGSFMEFLDVLVAEHIDQISKDPKSRQALVDLVAHAVARQVPTALALQERMRISFQK